MLSMEKNPDIQSRLIRSLGKYSGPSIRQDLLEYIDLESFRNRVFDAAVAAMKSQDDPVYIPVIKNALQEKGSKLTTRGFGGTLKTLAFLARNETEKGNVREYLIGFVNDRRKSVQNAALSSLGVLGDERAVAVLESFTLSSQNTSRKRAAQESLKKIRDQRPVSPELRNLRDSFSELQRQVKQITEQNAELNLKLDALGETQKDPVKEE
jgi:HEAT repeat protein